MKKYKRLKKFLMYLFQYYSLQEFHFTFSNDVEYAKNYVNSLNKYLLENNIDKISWWNVVANTEIM